MCVCVCRLLNLVKRAIAMYCICADPCVCVYASFSCVSCTCLCVLTCVFVFWVTVSPLTPHSVPQRTRKLWASICELWETGLVGSHIHTHTHREKRVTHSFYSLSKLTGWKLFCFVLSAEDTFLKSCILMCVIIPCFFLLVCVSECVQDSFFTSRPRLFPQVHHLPRWHIS